MQLLNILLLCLTTAIVMHSSHNVRGTVNAAMSMKVRYPDKDGKAALPKGGPQGGGAGGCVGWIQYENNDLGHVVVFS